MANYSIKYSCGHSGDKQLYGKHAQRDSYIEWAAKYGQCEDCRKQDKIKACEAVEAEHSLPTLAGSDKQIAWARTIRADKIGQVVEFVQRKRPAAMTDDQAVEFDRQYAAVMQTLYGKDQARWWIDNRDKQGQEIAQIAYKETRK